MRFLPSVLLFAILNGLIVVFRNLLEAYSFSVQVLLMGNAFIFALSFVSLLFQKKATQAASPQVSIRYFYLSFLIKLFLVATVAILYAKLSNEVNKPAVIACMLIYLMYTFLEIWLLLKAGKQRNA